jgi:hypothetical protein
MQYKFKVSFFKTVFFTNEDVVYRVSFRSDAAPYITQISTYLESVISLYAFNEKGERKEVQRFEEPPIIVHSFDVEKDTREKAEDEYEVTFPLGDEVFPNVLPEYESCLMRRDYALVVKGESDIQEDTTQVPTIYHDISISSPFPPEEKRRVVPEKDIPAFKTEFKEERFESEGKDLFGAFLGASDRPDLNK